MGRLSPPPRDPDSGIDYADGATPCHWCGNTPPAGDPWGRVHVGSAVWSKACADCWLAHDNGLKPRREDQ